MLKRSINSLIASLVAKETEIKVRDERLRSVRAREKVRLAPPAHREGGQGEILEDLVGESPVMGY